MLDATWTVESYDAYECPAFAFDVDVYRSGDKQMLFIHVAVFEWSRASLKHMHEVFDAFRACTDVPIFAIGKRDDEKFERFNALFGFKPLTTVVCANGEERRLFINIKDAVR